MAIETGQDAPDFTLYTDRKEPYTFSEERDGKNALLLFFPGAFTGVCTQEMCTVNDALADYNGLDAKVAAVSADAPAVLAEFRKQNDLRFPLLSDHFGNVSEKYGAQYSQEQHNLGYDRVAKRAAFVIDKDGIVRYAEVLENSGDLPDFDAIRDALESLN